MIRLRLNDPGFETLQWQDISLWSKRPARLWGLPSLRLNEHWGSFLAVIQPGAFNQLPSAKVKNEWSSTSNRPIRLHGVRNAKSCLLPSLHPPFKKIPFLGVMQP